MRRFVHRTALLLATLGIAIAPRASRAGEGVSGKGRADFSGSWALREDTSTRRPMPVEPADGATSGQQQGGRRGRRSGGGGEESGFAWELMEDVKRLVIVDDGVRIRISSAPGQERVLVTDGEEREIDDADGTANVTAKRKGARGERIRVTTKWHTGRERRETWELKSDPPRLVGTIEVKDRHPLRYEQIYEPAPPVAVTPPSTRTSSGTEVGEGPRLPEDGTRPAAGDSGTAPRGEAATPPRPAPEAVTPTAPVVRAPMSTCAIRPPRRTEDAELARMARIPASDAEARALAAVAPRKPAGVISGEPEVREGCLVYSFFLRFPGAKEAEEIVVDAGDGKLLAPEKE